MGASKFELSDCLEKYGYVEEGVLPDGGLLKITTTKGGVPGFSNVKEVGEVINARRAVLASRLGVLDYNNEKHIKEVRKHRAYANKARSAVKRELNNRIAGYVEGLKRDVAFIDGYFAEYLETCDAVLGDVDERYRKNKHKIVVKTFSDLMENNKRARELGVVLGMVDDARWLNRTCKPVSIMEDMGNRIGSLVGLVEQVGALFPDSGLTVRDLAGLLARAGWQPYRVVDGLNEEVERERLARVAREQSELSASSSDAGSDSRVFRVEVPERDLGVFFDLMRDRGWVVRSV